MSNWLRYDWGVFNKWLGERRQYRVKPLAAIWVGMALNVIFDARVTDWQFWAFLVPLVFLW